MQRTDNQNSDDPRGLRALIDARAKWKARAVVRFALRKLHTLRSALTFALLLAVVGLVLFSPLLLDDLAFRASYLLRPSQDAVTINEPIIVSDQPRLTVTSGTLSVPPSLTGQARTGEALAALIKGGSARLALKSPVIQFELSPDAIDERGTEPLVAPQNFVAAVSPLLTALEDATFETLMIRDGTILLKSAGGRVDTLDNVSLDISVKRKTAVRIKGSASFNGEALLFDATLGSRIGRHGNARMPIKAQINGSHFIASLDGRLEIGPSLQLVLPSIDLSIPNLRSVARWLGPAWPSGSGLKNFSAHGHVEWAGQTIAFQKGLFQLDGNEANGALSLNFGGSKPTIAGTLAFQDLEVAPYLEGWTSSGTDTATVSGLTSKSVIGQLKGIRDLTLPLMGSVNADLRISAEATGFGAWRAGRSAMSLALHDGLLLFNLADLVLPSGGSVAGDIQIQGPVTAPTYTLHGRIADVELADVSAGLVGPQLLRGLGQISFDLKGAGRAGMDFLSRLNGRIDLAMPSGGSAACTMKELTTLAEDRAGEGCRSSTKLAPFKATASSLNGVVAAERIEALASGELMKIEGTVDLVTSVMQLKVSSTTQPSGFAVGVDLPPDIEPVHQSVTVQGRPEEVRITAQPK